MDRSNEVFQLYANCLPVKGARRSLIVDLQKPRLQFIPNGLYQILTEMKGSSLAEIKGQHGNEQDDIINNYFELLEREDYGFWCDEPERFPPLELAWDRPGKVTNAIVDIDRNSNHDYQRIFAQLDDLGCQAVQIRSYDTLSLQEIADVVVEAMRWRLRHLDLLVKYHSELTSEALSDLCVRYQVISGIGVHTSPSNSRVVTEIAPVAILYSRDVITPLSCGQVSPEYFSFSIEHFTESMHFNSCLNRKISIAANGEIKGCPSMRQSCGNMNDTTLKSAIENPLLVQLAGITKDQVSICKDCEFRYICTDCRVYLSDPGDLYSKPEKCAYNPYTAEWEAKEGCAIPV